VVVVVGLTEMEVPVTVPMPLIESVGVGFPETDQDRFEVLPETIDVGEAVKEAMLGAVVAAAVVALAVAEWPETFPAAS
jgi:hypothetical protein